MKYFIENIYIQNFKSMEWTEIFECRRINLFIGRPNVGKSNIIEALSILTIPYLKENSSKKLTNLIRLENETELFYNGNWEKESFIDTKTYHCNIQFHPQENLRIFIHNDGQTYGAKVDDKLNVSALTTKTDFTTNVKKYLFKHDIKYKRGHSRYLVPPFGNNLLSIIDNFADLKDEVLKFFANYDLQVAFDRSSQTIKVIERSKDGIFLVPYNSIADTLQRQIFFLAAIKSNRNSVLLFEEPEAHSFPPYMSHLTQEMISSKSNQFFVATHSPFILNDLLENANDELAVYNVDYKNKKTIVRRLSDSELHEVLQFGVDLFTNNESFL